MLKATVVSFILGGAAPYNPRPEQTGSNIPL